MSQTEVQLIKTNAVQTGDIANSAVTNEKIAGLASSKLTGALPAISGAALTNLPASGKASNLVINGSMQVAQRNLSSTDTGFATVDRIKTYTSGTDEAPTFSQADVASGTTPYTLGFRKCFKILNGNQTSVSAGDLIYFRHIIESQDVAASGWNYKNSSSNVTLSFWVKSSVAQDFKGYLRATSTSGANSSQQQYSFATGSLSANTWTKITKTIPGHANLEFDNDTGSGLDINISTYIGSTYSSSSTTENAWIDYSSSGRVQDYSSDSWYTTDDATFEVTGIQLEVGDSATDFEHLTYGDELRRCQRYYYKHAYGTSRVGSSNVSSNNMPVAMCACYDASNGFGMISFPVTMRAQPTLEYENVSNGYKVLFNNTLDYFNNLATQQFGDSCAIVNFTGGFGVTADSPGWVQIYKTNSYVAFTAEL